MPAAPFNQDRLRIVQRAIFSAWALAFAYAACGQCPTRYAVDIVPGPPCQFVASSAGVSGISPLGEICGGWGDCNGFGHGAAWFGQGAWETIPLSPTVSGISPTGINSARHITAFVSGFPNPDNYRAAFIDLPSGTTTVIGGLPGADTSFANAISEDSTVCGYSFNSATGNPPHQAFIWQNGQMTRLTLPYGSKSVAYDISDSGSVCGWMGDANYTTSHAFIWTNGMALDLGVIPSGQSAAAYGISNNGKACGTGWLPASGGKGLTRHAFYWSDGVMLDLGVLPVPGHNRSTAYAVNDDGFVVGHSSNEVLGGHGFVWQNGVMHDLNDLISPGLNVEVRIAWAINNAGQIAADGRIVAGPDHGDQVALRLNPIPPIPGDFNCNQVVNIDDLLGVVTNWGPALPGTPGAFADFNADRVVNIDDLLVVISNWSSG